MPANLTPEYKNAEERFRQAKTSEEKLQALEEMLSTIPKHKGTDKMQADIKRRIAKFKDREKGKKAKAGTRIDPYHVEREGAAQIALVGPPNSGKSTFLANLTKAESEVAPYPYTTRKPIPGMMHFENIQFQLVDLPPLSDQFMETWVPRVVRNAQAVLLVVSLDSDDLLEETETVLRLLMESKVKLVGWRQWEKREKPEAWRKTLAVGTKLDREKAEDNANIFLEFFGDRFEMIKVSIEQGLNVEELKRAVFDMLEIIRVYTKAPGKDEDRSSPYIIPTGTTVIGLAEKIHKDMVKLFKYSKVWGSSAFDGQRVQRDYVLQDEDVVELHVG
ncbi:GTPase [Acidobacteriota bacterium]